MKHNCPFSSGPQARAGRENFLPECLLLAKGEMKCHTNYLGSGQCQENWLQLWEAAARSPITEWGWAGFLCCWPRTRLSRCARETPAHTGCACSTLRLWAFPGGGPRHWGLNQLFHTKSFWWHSGPIPLKEVNSCVCSWYLDSDGAWSDAWVHKKLWSASVLFWWWEEKNVIQCIKNV